jgi:hypothetical protein
VGQTIGKVAAWEAWQAALQSGEPVGEVTHELTYTYDDEGYCTGKYMKGVVSDEIFKLPHGTKLYTTPQPVVDVNQQLVEALQAVLDCGSTSDQWWIDKAREALLSAGKGE